MRVRLLVCTILALLLLLNSGGESAAAQTPADMPPPWEDSIALEAFVDGLMAAQLTQMHIPGAVVSIVHNGAVVLTKGYGYADLETLSPAHAHTSLFRIGSVAKLFTWTAAMQLVEAGMLDLDADINTYLVNTSVRIPSTYFAPITMRHLMAHTPGLEDRTMGLFARDAGALAPLDTLLLDLPTRVAPPGEFAAYSNYGSALAALVVQEISGMAWADYVETHILEPLQMARTTVRQPVPDALAGDLAQGYTFVGARQRLETFEFVPLAPAGSASATAADMARFMLAHLQLGRLDGAQILQESTARTMQTQHFTHSPFLPGMAHGFMEYGVDSDRWFGHGGDTLWFHSGLYLSTEHDMGLFVSYNGANGGWAREEFFRAFRTRYFDEQGEIQPTPPTNTPQQLALYAGDYRTNRLGHTTPDKVAGLLSTVNVSVDPQGYLLLNGLQPTPVRYTEIGPGRFREVSDTGLLGREEIVFQFDAESGQPVRLLHSAIPIMTFERLAWFERMLLHALIFGGGLILFLGAVIVWPIQIWQARSRVRRGGPWARIARWVGWATALILLIYLVGFLVAFRDPLQLVFGLPPIFNYIGWLPLLSVPLVVAMWVFAGMAWRGTFWRPWARIFYTLIALLAAAVLWMLWYWNFLQAPLIL